MLVWGRAGSTFGVCWKLNVQSASCTWGQLCQPQALRKSSLLHHLYLISGWIQRWMISRLCSPIPIRGQLNIQDALTKLHKTQLLTNRLHILTAEQHEARTLVSFIIISLLTWAAQSHGSIWRPELSKQAHIHPGHGVRAAHRSAHWRQSGRALTCSQVHLGRPGGSYVFKADSNDRLTLTIKQNLFLSTSPTLWAESDD